MAKPGDLPEGFFDDSSVERVRSLVFLTTGFIVESLLLVFGNTKASDARFISRCVRGFFAFFALIWSAEPLAPLW